MRLINLLCLLTYSVAYLLTDAQTAALPSALEAEVARSISSMRS